MKIVAFDIEPWEHESFAALQQAHDVTLVREPLSAENAGDYADANIISGFIYSKMNKAVLEQFHDLKLIATRSTGYDHIDQAHCAANDITICNVPKYGSNTVAEHVFGLLLTISHRLAEAVDRTRKGDFSPKGLQGFDLYGKTFGVIGTGDIGLSAIRIANGFGMNVIAHDIAPDHATARDLGFEYVDLDTLLRTSDIISLHVPANPQTKHLIDAAEFETMKDGAVLINTARGDIVEVHALVRALAEGKLAAAGLDVLPDEPIIREEAEVLRSVYENKHDLSTLLANHVITHMRNVIVTPHSAFNTREAVRRIIETTVSNIESFIDGRPENVAGED